MELTVDDQVSVATVAIGSFSQLTLSGPLFLGGVSREEEGDIAEEIFNEEGFIGCVQEFVVNSKPVSMISAAFSGINVLNCPHPCSDRPCWNGGICQPTGEEFNCACPLGFRPSDCREKVPLDDTVPMFLGNGYLHYSDPQVTELLSGRETYFRVRFRTWRNGLILWVGQQENTLNSQFASLSVESGLVTFRYNLGHGDLVLIGNSSVIQNGEWHIVEAIRSDQSASIRVDDGPVVIKTSASQVQSLNPNSGLYLGGAENVELQTQGRFREGFLGCVSEVNLDPSYSVYLMSQADRGQNVDTCS
ncbi:unnamed protein product [Cyprideis torosa]|uniref:Uncharacterized protein n=1 Tax=Cyprideis torosa TaxID=163714 RepID=A0A7R8WLN8_9CRUS|nr:unnamed protein product [Cyprideis torosa]CAG0897490.1 unnamed protein product [Cyprideis torosa]